MTIQSELTPRGFVLNKNNKFLTSVIAVAVVILLSVPSIFIAQKSAYAAGPPVVGLGAVLTRVSDGSAPFASVDPNANNGLVATLDTASYSLDINFNTLDAQPHTVNNVAITATLVSSSADVRWMLNTLPTACGSKSLSVDGKTLTCNISGTYSTGTALNVSAGWFGQASVPNGTQVDTSFVVSATMASNPGNVDNPTNATSNVDSLDVVSIGSEYEVRKMSQNSSVTLSRDGTGQPEYVVVDWGVQVELKSPTPNELKGISSANLGDLTLEDLMQDGTANQIPLQSQGEFVGCFDVNTTNDPYQLPNSHATSVGQSNSVDDSGTWTCSQPGGIGDAISIQATGINWGPRWFPHGKSSSTPSLWAYGNSGIANEIYNNPSGTNNRAAVATQIVRVRYPYAAVLAFDQTAGDSDTRADYINWCNDIGNIDAVGATDGIDDSSNNTACAPFSNISGPGNLVSKKYLKYQPVSSAFGPESELGLAEGVLRQSPTDGDSDNYLASGMKFSMQLAANVDNSSVNGLADWNMCDAFEQQKYHLIPDGGSTPSSGFLTSASHSYYNMFTTGTPAAGYPVIDDSDIVVEFASTGSTWANSAQMRTYDCDSNGLTWESDPTNLSGGISSANLVRVRVINSKEIPPGLAIYVRLSVEADQNLDEGDELYNFAQYKASNYRSNAWNRAGSNCIPENHPWNASSGLYSCQVIVDRAIVIVPSPLTQISDQPSAPTQDAALPVALGDTKTFTIRSGTAFNADAFVDGVQVHSVLPPGLEYISSTLTPDQTIPDCNEAINPTCVTDPNARTNIGYRTIIWDRGDIDFDYTNNDGTVQSNRTLFGEWTMTTRVASFVPNAVSLKLLAWTTAESGLSQLTYPLISRTTGTALHNDTLSGPLDDDWLTVATAQAFGIEKYVSEEEIALNGTARFTLAFGNLTGGAKVIDAIDILPYNNDSRLQNTTYDGGYSLSDVIDVDSFINNVYVTSDPVSNLNADPNDASNPAVGTGKWLCTFAQLGNVGCPSADEVTAIRIKTISMNAGQYGQIQLRLETFDNDGEEVYTNNFTARATGLALPTISSDVTVTTPSCLSIGNRLFIDANRDGEYDNGEVGIGNITIKLMAFGDDDNPFTNDDEEFKTAVTDSNGHWYIECIPPGEYYVMLDNSLFENSGALSGYEIAPDGQSNISDERDEVDDHNLLFEDDMYRTSTFELGYNGPVGEDGTHRASDAYDNLTIDLGLAAVIPPTTTTTPGSNVAGSNLQSVTGSLAYTGMAYAIFAIGSVLILLGMTLRKSSKLLMPKKS